MILFPPAKINIGLNVVERRADGYHELETIMAAIPLYDVLEIIPSKTFKWQQSGLLIDETSDSNLCIRAYQLIQQEYSIAPIYMHLRKCIPMGAGLGGGSADAAYVIRGLNQLFELNISIAKQKELAATLGSDCAFFIEDGPQLAVGRGEILSPQFLNLSGYHILLVKPNIHINTAQAYNGVHISGDKGSLSQLVQADVTSWKQTIKNDFEQHIFNLHPVLNEIKDTLYSYGAVYASMSGSGSTMYGLFKEKPQEIAISDATVFSLKL